jgi:hypothetical protein
MPFLSPAELKRALIREGFEIYRTAGSFVVLADRVRDNLIMDSGVALGVVDGSAGGPAASAAEGPATGWAEGSSDGAGFIVRIVLRAQASQFPGESAEQLVARARELARPFAERGYAETACEAIEMKDPGDPNRVLDTCYEVRWERADLALDGAVAELRAALSQTRHAASDADD